MNWREIKAKWEADPTIQDAYEQEFPYASTALAVARLRAEQDLTQEQLAQRVGTTQSVIARVESGRHAVNVALLTRIARAVGQVFQPHFRPADAPIESEMAAVNDTYLFDAGVVISELVILDNQTVRVYWPDAYPHVGLTMTSFGIEAHVDDYAEYGEATGVHLSPGVGPVVPFGNEPFTAGRWRDVAMRN